MYDFLVGPTPQGWTIHVAQEMGMHGPYMTTYVISTHLTAYPTAGEPVPLGWDAGQEISEAAVGKDGTVWIKLSRDHNDRSLTLHPYRIEPTLPPVRRRF